MNYKEGALITLGDVFRLSGRETPVIVEAISLNGRDIKCSGQWYKTQELRSLIICKI